MQGKKVIHQNKVDLELAGLRIHAPANTRK